MKINFGEDRGADDKSSNKNNSNENKMSWMTTTKVFEKIFNKIEIAIKSKCIIKLQW